MPKDYDDAGQAGAYVDSTLFSDAARDAFTQAVLEGVNEAAESALGGTLTAVIIKQLKGAGMHASGAKSHNLYPDDEPDKPNIAAALERGALTPEAWALVRTNMSRAGGGPAGKTVVTEFERALADVGQLPMQAFAPGEKAVPASAMAEMVAELGRRDPLFVVSAASLLTSLAALPPQPVAAADMAAFVRRGRPGVELMGSHVDKSTR